jgi:predicted MFS family arabinose efflux permease
MNPVLLILNVLHFLNDGTRTAFTSLLPFIAKDLHLSFTQVGILSASQGFMVMLFSLPSAYLAMRIGGFKILFLALLLYSVGAIGIGLAPNVWMLMVIYYLGSVGFGLFHTIGNTLVARNSDSTNTGRSMGLYATFGDIGRISLPVVALFFASFFGWRETFFIIAGCGLATYAITQWVLPLKKHVRHKSQNKNTQSYKEWLFELPRFLKQKRLLLVTAAGAIDNIAANPIFLFLPFFVLEKGFPVWMLGIFTAAYFAGSLTGKTLLGYGADKFGTAKVFMIAEFCMAITLVIFTLFNNVFLLLGLSLLLGLFTRGTTPLVATLFSEITHEDHYEKAYGIGETIFGMSVIVAPILMGMLADEIGISAVFYMAAALGLLATLPIFLLLKSGSIKDVRIAPVEKID